MALNGRGALINKNTFKGGGDAYWKEGTKSNHYGNYYLIWTRLTSLDITSGSAAVELQNGRLLRGDY